MLRAVFLVPGTDPGLQTLERRLGATAQSSAANLQPDDVKWYTAELTTWLRRVMETWAQEARRYRDTGGVTPSVAQCVALHGEAYRFTQSLAALKPRVTQNVQRSGQQQQRQQEQQQQQQRQPAAAKKQKRSRKRPKSAVAAAGDDGEGEESDAEEEPAKGKADVVWPDRPSLSKEEWTALKEKTTKRYPQNCVFHLLARCNHSDKCKFSHKVRKDFLTWAKAL